MAAANWRTLKKLDAHIHILPDAVHTANPNSDDVWVYADLRQYVQIMRENHIERAVIMPFNDPFLMSMEFTAGAVHRNLAEMKRRYPGRFYAFADIDVRNSRAETVDALCRAIDDHALDGIKLHPNNSGLALDSDYNCAIFAFAQERHIPVAVHSYPNAEDDLSAAKRIVKTAERYPDLKLIVSHMGGGITVSAHRQGRVIDTSNALNGAGPFSPERAGTLPPGPLIDLCFSGEYTREELQKLINGRGGLLAHLGTTSVPEILRRIDNNDLQAMLVLRAMCYNVAKEIGAMAIALKGKADAILLTGGIAHNKRLTDFIAAHVDFIAPVFVYPGENELEALARNALAVLRGDCEAKTYYKADVTA